MAWRRLLKYLLVLVDILLQKLRSFRLGALDTVGEFSIEGKTVLITGPTSGIGKATAWALAKRKAHVVLACRNLERGERLKREFSEEANRLGLPPPSLEVALLDVSDLASVRKLAEEWRSAARPLHILINNAGIFDIGGVRKVDEAGMEQHMLTNHLGPFLLTLGLLPCLRKEARRGVDCRVVNVVSVMHLVAYLDLDDPFLAKPREYASDRAYGQSKLAMILFGAELQRRLAVGEGITVCSVHPGEAVTEVARGIPGILQWFYKNTMNFILYTPEEGARCSVYCATAKRVIVEARRHLGYFGSNAKPEAPSREAHSVELAERMWKWSADTTELPAEWDLPPRRERTETVTTSRRDRQRSINNASDNSLMESSDVNQSADTAAQTDAPEDEAAAGSPASVPTEEAAPDAHQEPPASSAEAEAEAVVESAAGDVSHVNAPELAAQEPLKPEAEPPQEDTKPEKRKPKQKTAAGQKPVRSDSEEQKQLEKHKDVIAELENAVKREVNARKELEDMLMRMERHLRQEEEARKNSDGLLDASLQNEVRLKKQLDTALHRHAEREKEMEQQTLRTVSDREALEEMRQQMEEEISAAREAAHKAVEDLKTAEDRVRSAERSEMAKMESEYQKRISMLGLELERVRQELIIRTKLLSDEMERWRQQAEFTAAAVIEAKAEVSERKRDLDNTRDKMDKLMDRLHVGREHGLVLQASLTAANAYTTQAQRTLIQSMESSFQSNVQQALPWGGQVGAQTALVTEDMTDPMALLNRGLDIAGTKSAAKPRMIENSKQTGRQKTTRPTRRGRA